MYKFLISPVLCQKVLPEKRLLPKCCPNSHRQHIKRNKSKYQKQAQEQKTDGSTQNRIKRYKTNTLMYLTRNQFGSNATWVRIPPSAPKATPCGVLLFIFATNYARAARWDSDSPCPALCVPPGCNSPADCCKGAGESHRLRQVSLLISTLGSDFLLPLCKIPVLFL